MALKIRLARRGAKKSPFYHIVAADSRSARDGHYIEKLGFYNPMLDQGATDRVRLETDKIKEYLAKGAQPTERVARILGQAGVIEMPAIPNRPNKSAPGKKAQDRIAEKKQKEEDAKAAAEEAKAAAAAEAAAPKEEAPAEEAAPVETAEAPVEETASEEESKAE